MTAIRKILLVEDNLELRNLYAIFLRQHHYDVALAADGQEGLAVAKSFAPDLIFLDIMMPKLSGFEVLKILRSDPAYNAARVKIIILTNLGDTSNIPAVVRRDMDGYVIKAEIELRNLIDIIRSFEK